MICFGNNLTRRGRLRVTGFFAGFGILAVLLLGGCAMPKVALLRFPQRAAAYEGEKITGSRYVVRRGDTLMSIAWRAEADFRALVRWNRLAPPYRIRVGQTLFVAPPPAGDAQGEAPPPPPVAHPATRPHEIPSHAPDAAEPMRRDGAMSWQWPVAGALARGYQQGGNKGIDIDAEGNAVVRAAAPGRVVYGGQGLIGYGNLVILKHGERFLSAYGNNARLLVREGDAVRAGQVIGELDPSASGGQVLHFEIRRAGKPVNPLDFLPQR